MRFLAVLFGLILFAVPSTSSAQTIATSICYRDGEVVSFVRTEIIDTDSMAEILTHEARHRAQYRAHFAVDSTCGSSSPDSSLTREIAAYCASDSVRFERTRDSVEVATTTLRRLLFQFSDTLRAETIIARWMYSGCPFALPPKATAGP